MILALKMNLSLQGNQISSTLESLCGCQASALARFTWALQCPAPKPLAFNLVVQEQRQLLQWVPARQRQFEIVESEQLRHSRVLIKSFWRQRMCDVTKHWTRYTNEDCFTATWSCAVMLLWKYWNWLSLFYGVKNILLPVSWQDAW